MPLTYYGETSVAYPAIFGGTAAPTAYYFGLQTTTIYPGASSAVAVASGTYIIPTTYGTSTPGTGVSRIFVAMSSGTTSGTEPTWSNVSARGSVLDGTVTWQDVASTTSPYWLSTAPTFNEVSGGGYARVAYANNATNFPLPTGSSPTQGSNSQIISFPTSTSAWGTIAAITLHTLTTGGNVIAFAYLSSALTISGSGTTPSIPVGSFTLSLT